MNHALNLTHTSHLRLCLTPMSQDQDDEEISQTDVAPRRSTLPPGPADDRAEAFVREALQSPKLPSDFRQLAENELVALYRTAIGMHESLLGTSGLLEQNRRNTVEDIARVVDRGFDRVWERVAPRLDRQDGKIDGLKGELAELKQQLKGALDRVDELELALGLKEKRESAQGTPPAEPT